MCPCEREKGIVCATHCRREGCRGGWHAGHCLRPDQQRTDATAVAEARIRADEREKTAQRIVAHADKHAPADGNPAQRRMRRHLLIAARVAAGLMSMEQVGAVIAAGDYMACRLNEAGGAISEGER